MPIERLPPTQDLPQVPEVQADRLGEQFLKFRLSSDTTGLLPVNQLAEILTTSYQSVIPIPGMPEWVIGVYNWRGEILWTIDLGHLLGMTPWYQKQKVQDTHSMIVLRTTDAQQSLEKSLAVGLIAQQIEGIHSYNPDAIESPPSSAVTSKLAPFLRGYWLDTYGEMLAVLDGAAILDRLPKSPQTANS